MSNQFDQAFPSFNPEFANIGGDQLLPEGLKERSAADQKLTEIIQAKQAKEFELKSARESKALMSDDAADTAIGGLINTLGGVVGTTGDIAAWVAGVPKTARDMINPGMAPGGFAYRATEFPALLGKKLQDALDPLYNPVHIDRLNNKFIETYQENEGFLNVVKEMAKVAISNPVAGAELFITNLPYMKALAARGIISIPAFIGLVSDGTQQSLEKFRSSHGREPEAEERAIMLGTNLTGAALERVESLFLLGKIGKPITSTAQRARAVPIRYGTGGITEFGQEGAQVALTDIGGYQGKLLTDPNLQAQVLQDSIVAGAMGGASGSVGGAGMRAIQPSVSGSVVEGAEAFQTTKTYQDLPQTTKTPVEAYRAFEAAPTVQTMNEAISSLANNTHPNASVIAADIAKVAKEANLEVNPDIKAFLDKTSEPSTIVKTVKGVATKINTTVNQVSNWASEKTITDEAFHKDPEGSADSFMARLSRTAPKEEDYLKAKEETQRVFITLKREIENAENNSFKIKLKEKQTKILETLTALHQQIYNPNTEESIDIISKAEPGDKTLGSRINAVLGSMQVDGSTVLTNEQFDKLENSKVLTDQQKEYIRLYRDLNKNPNAVTKDLKQSGEGFKGNNKYLAEIDSAILLGNQALTSTALKDFTNWVDRYVTNREKVVNTYNDVLKTGKTELVPKLAEGQSFSIHKNSNKPIDSNTPGFIDALKSNIELMKEAKKFAELKYELAFGKKEEVKAEPKQEVDTKTTIDEPITETISQESTEYTFIEKRGNNITFKKGKTVLEVKSVEDLITIGKELQKLIQPNNREAWVDYFSTLFRQLEEAGIKYQSVNVRLDNISKDKRGNYDSKSNTITVYTQKFSNNEGVLPIKALLHEYVHRITYLAIDKNPNVKKRIKELMDRLKKENPTLSEHYGFKNEFEFMAEVISSPRLQKELAKIKGTEPIVQRLKNLFNYILSKVLNKNDIEQVSALSESLNIFNEITSATPTKEKQEILVKEDSKKETTKISPFSKVKNKLAELAISLFNNSKTKELFNAVKEIEYTFGKSLFNDKSGILESESAKELKGINTLKNLSNTISNYHKKLGGSRALLHNNPVLQFIKVIDEKTELPKQIADAIAVASYSFIGAQGNSLIFNDQDTLKRMLGYDSREVLNNRAYMLSNAGKNINSIADSIGNEVIKLLNLNIPNELDRKRVVHSLGFAGIHALSKENLLEHSKIDLVAYRALFRDPPTGTLSESERRTTVRFISVKRNPEDTFKANESVSTIIADFKEDQDKFKEAFNSTIFRPKPQTEPRTKPPKYLVGTNQELSDIAKEAVIAANSRAYLIDFQSVKIFKEWYEKDPIGLMKSLSTGAKGTGYIDPDTVHIDDYAGVVSKNRSIQRDIENFFEYVAQLPNENQQVYFNHDVWKNQRMGVSSESGINPQGNTIIRGLIGLMSSRVTIDRNNLKEVTIAKMILVAPFGLEIGKNKNEEFEIEFDKLAAEIKDRNLHKEDTSSQDILDFLLEKEPDHLTHALNAFNGIVNYINSDGSSDFNMLTTIELDGKSNGPAIGALQTGLFKDVYNNAVGIFFNKFEENYVDVIDGKERLGAYEQIATLWDRELKLISDRSKNEGSIILTQEKYLQPFMDDIGVTKSGRNLSKYPFMKNIYGQGPESMIRDIGANLLGGLRKIIAEQSNILNSEQSTQEEKTIASNTLKEIDGDIQALTGHELHLFKEQGNAKQISLEILQDPLVGSLSETYGESLKKVVDAEFGSFLKFRDSINTVMNTLAAVFIAAMNTKIAKYERETNQIATEELIMDWAYNDPVLSKLLPIYMTPNAKFPKEGFFGLLIDKSRSTKSTVQFNLGIAEPGYSVTDLEKPNNNKTTTHSLSGGILAIKFEELGVGGFISLIHSIDGSLMQRLQAKYKIFGVHDAGYISVQDLDVVGAYMNELFLILNRDYSIKKAVWNRYEEIMQSLGLKNPGDTTPALIQNSLESLGISEQVSGELTERIVSVHSGVFKKVRGKLVLQYKPAEELSFGESSKEALYDRDFNIHQFPLENGHATHGTFENTLNESTDANIEKAIEEDVDSEITTLYKGQEHIVIRETALGFTIESKVDGKRVNITKRKMSETEQQRIIEALNLAPKELADEIKKLTDRKKGNCK